MTTATEIAQEAMAQADGDVMKATKLIEQQARGDMNIWRTLTDDLLRTACYDACRSICRNERRIIWNAPGYDAGGKGERIKAHASTLLEWPLPGGMKLKDATAKDLIDAASFYSKQANQMASISIWLEAVARKVKHKTVGETLTDHQLRKLRDDSRGNQANAA